MESAEGRPRVYDEDIDGKRPEDEGGAENNKENGEGQAGTTDDKKKKPKKPILKLDPSFLIDNPRALKRLYTHVVTNGDKNFQFKGKGHEISDFSRVMRVLKGWHFEVMPKLEISYFADRMVKSGNDKDVKTFLNKLRNVYKGLEVLDDTQLILPEGEN